MADPVDTDIEAQQRPPAPSSAPARTAARSPFQVLKPGQGIHVRWGSAIGAGALAVFAAEFVWSKSQLFAVVERSYLVRLLLPVVVLLGLGYLIFWLVGRNPKVVDFMIATEGEMKKVNWSSRKEVWGATKVVIVTVLALALILFVVDMFFIALFSAMHVLKLDVVQALFGPGTE